MANNKRTRTEFIALRCVLRKSSIYLCKMHTLKKEAGKERDQSTCINAHLKKRGWERVRVKEERGSNP